MPLCCARLLALAFFAFTITSVWAAESDVGRAVKVNSQGINHAAHIIAVEGAKYRIRYDDHREGRPDEELVTVDRLKNSDFSAFKPAGAASSASAALPRTIPTGHYTCAMFVSGTGLVNNGDFTLHPNGTYERGGTRGNYTYAAATGRVTFQGGVMDGRAAEYEKRNLPTLHLKGNSGRVLAAGQERNVASCEQK